MTKGYIESGLCCIFDLDKLRMRLYTIREVPSRDHPMALVASDRCSVQYKERPCLRSKISFLRNSDGFPTGQFEIEQRIQSWNPPAR